MEAQVHRLVVPRTARYLTLGAIDGEGGLTEVWVLCHGYGQLAAEFLEATRALAAPERVLVAPEGLARFYHEDHRRVGASWMTREDRDSEMEDYIRYLDLLHEQLFSIVDRASVRLSALGFSQGVATVTRWAVRGQADVDHLVLWGGATPPELDDRESLARLQSMRVTLVSGTRDTLFPESDREQHRKRLRDHGVPFTELSFEGGHRLDDETLTRLPSIGA